MKTKKYYVYGEYTAGHYKSVNYNGFKTLKGAKEIAKKWCEAFKCNVVIRNQYNVLVESYGYRKEQ